MRYLIDTHVIIWLLLDSEKLSIMARKLIEESKNEIFVSTISLWEISLKYKKGKLKLKGLIPKEISGWLDKINIKTIPLSSELSLGYCDFETNHNDPFDNMLMYTAVKEKLVFLTADKKILDANIKKLEALW
jgi:PIN domain nuclease of toxin-antitoxin system